MATGSSRWSPRPRVSRPAAETNQASPPDARWAVRVGWCSSWANQAIAAGKRWPRATGSTSGGLSGAEDDAAVGGDDAADDGLDAGHGGEVVDAVLAEVVGADVEDGGGVAAVDAEAAAEDAAAGDLEDGEVDLGVAEDGAGGGGSGPVAGLERSFGDGHAVGGGVAGGEAGLEGDAGEQAGGGGLAVGAGDEGDGDAAEAVPWDSFGRRREAGGVADGAASVADRELIVVGEDREVAGGGGGAQGGDAGLLLVGDGLAPGGQLAGGVASASGPDSVARGGIGGLDRPVVDVGGEVEVIGQGGEHEVGAGVAMAVVVLADVELDGPAERVQGSGEGESPGREDGPRGFAGIEGDLGDRARPAHVQVRSGEAARVEGSQGPGIAGGAARVKGRGGAASSCKLPRDVDSYMAFIRSVDLARRRVWGRPWRGRWFRCRFQLRGWRGDGWREHERRQRGERRCGDDRWWLCGA